MPPPDSSLQDVIDLVVIGPGSLHDTNNGANGKLQRNMPKELVVGIRAGHSPSDEGSTILDSPRNISSGKFADVRISGSPSGAIASSSAEDERAQQRERLRGCPRIPDGEVNLLCNIGEGGFCEVFEGKWFGAPVAVKRLKLTGQPERDAALAHAFEQEIGLHHSLAFPLIVPALACCAAPTDAPGDDDEGSDGDISKAGGGSEHGEDDGAANSTAAGTSRTGGSCSSRSSAAGGSLFRNDLMLVMEQAPLGSLFGLLHAHSHRSAPLEMPMALRVCLAADCCSVVTFLHAKGIVHRDLKSMNFLVFQGWRLKLCDFGLSVPIEDCQTPSAATEPGSGHHSPNSSPSLKQNGGAAATAAPAGAGSVVAADLQPRGTYAWMAPESMASRSYSFASDVYALSLLIYELTRRQVPFEGWANDAIEAAVVKEGTRPSLDEDDAQASGPYHVPSAVMDVMEAGWSHDPSTRPHAAEMEEELRCVGDERFGGDPRNDDLLAALNIHLGSDQGEEERHEPAAAANLSESNNGGGANSRASAAVADNSSVTSSAPAGNLDLGDEALIAASTERNTKSQSNNSNSNSSNSSSGGPASVTANTGTAGATAAVPPASAPSNGVKLERLRAALTSPSAAELEGGDTTPNGRRHHDTGSGSPRKKGGGGGAHGPPHSSSRVLRWDDGLDVGRLRIAFLEMAESGVIFDKHKELSLHLSRSQAKPFVHNSATNSSVFLDDVQASSSNGTNELISPEVVAEANAIMHKLIRHYMRKHQQQEQQHPTRQAAASNGHSSAAAAVSFRPGRHSAEAATTATSLRPHTRAAAKIKSANPAAGASLSAAAGAGQLLMSPPLAAAPKPPMGGFFLSPGSELEQAGQRKNPRSSLGPKKSTGGPRVV